MNDVPDKSSILKVLALPVAALAVGAGITYMITTAGSGGKIVVDPTGGISVEVEANDNFSDVLGKAIEADPKAVNGVLEAHGYFELTSDRLITKLSEIDTSTAEGQKVAVRLRKMLWDLEGPFRRPETLVGADSRMVRALEDLEQSITDAEEASSLLAALWEQNLDQRGIFMQRLFPATVKKIVRAPTDTPRIYACSGGPLVIGRVVEIFTEIGSVLAAIEHDPTLFSCDGSSISTRQLLTGKVPVPLGLNETAFNMAIDPTGSRTDVGDSKPARFVVYPRNLIGG